MKTITFIFIFVSVWRSYDLFNAGEYYVAAVWFANYIITTSFLSILFDNERLDREIFKLDIEYQYIMNETMIDISGNF